MNEFISLTKNYTKAQNRKLVEIICKKHIDLPENSDPYEHQFDSYLLSKKVIIPTLKQWIKDEPENPDPLKWAVLCFYHTEEDRHIFLEQLFSLIPKDKDIKRHFNETLLERLLVLDPNDDDAREYVIRKYLSYIDFSLHHLESDSAYIGNPSEDLKLCLCIEEHLKYLQNKSNYTELSERLKESRLLIQDYQHYRKSLKSFTEWQRSK